MRASILAMVLTLCAALRALCGAADQPFDVSLWSSAADLSPYYQAVVREATQMYRGDAVGPVVVRREYYIGNLRTGTIIRLLQAHVDPDLFPAELLTLPSTVTSEGADSTSVSLQPAAPNPYVGCQGVASECGRWFVSS